MILTISDEKSPLKVIAYELLIHSTRNYLKTQMEKEAKSYLELFEGNQVLEATDHVLGRTTKRR